MRTLPPFHAVGISLPTTGSQPHRGAGTCTTLGFSHRAYGGSSAGCVIHSTTASVRNRTMRSRWGCATRRRTSVIRGSADSAAAAARRPCRRRSLHRRGRWLQDLAGRGFATRVTFRGLACNEPSRRPESWLVRSNGEDLSKCRRPGQTASTRVSTSIAQPSVRSFVAEPNARRLSRRRPRSRRALTVELLFVR
jgi:hypothetical protein